MKIRLFGDIEITPDGERSRQVTAVKPRTLLCLLAVNRNQFIEADALLEALWTGNPPTTAATALRGHISTLRRLIEPVGRRPAAGGGRITSAAGAYRLAVSVAEVDIARFEAGVDDARRLRRLGELRESVGVLKAALDEWTGAPFVGAASALALESAESRLHKVRVEALEEVADLLAHVGDHDAAIAAARSARSTAPLSDSLVYVLAYSLARRGDSTPALRTIAEHSARLDQELGVALPPRLADLERSILLQELPDLVVESRPQAEVSSLSVHRPSDFIGRSEELQTLNRLIEDDSQTRRLIVIEGTAGTGKSALLDRLADSRRANGDHVLIARFPFASDDPYRPWRDLLEQRIQLGGSGPELDAARDMLNDGTGDDARPPHRAWEYTSVPATRLVADTLANALRSECTLLIVVDDLHWADVIDLQILRHVARHSVAPRVRIIGTLRSDEPLASDTRAMIRAIDSDSTPTTMVLDGVPRESTRRLLLSASPPRMHATMMAAADAAYELTRGNPLFVREIARDLSERNVQPSEVADDLATRAPTGVEAVTRTRLGRLSPECRAAIEVAATAAHEVDTTVIADVLGEPVLATEDTITEAEDSRFLERTPAGFRFSHELIRIAAINSLDEERRRSLHIALARAIARQSGLRPSFADLSRIAEHHLAGEGPKSSGTVAAARNAARAALQAHAPAVGARWLTLLTESSGESESSRRARDLFDLARCHQQLEQPEAMRQSLAAAVIAARRGGDLKTLVDLAIFNYGGLALPRYRPDQLELLDEALNLVDDESHEERIRLLSARASTRLYTDPAGEAADATMCKSLAPKASDAGQARAYWCWHRHMQRDASTLYDRLQIGERMVAAARSGDDKQLLAFVVREHAIDRLKAGEIHEFEDGLQELRNTAFTASSVLGIYHTLCLESTYQVARGDIALGERTAAIALEYGERFDVADAHGAHLLTTFTVCTIENRLHEWRPLLRRTQPAEGHEVFVSALSLAAFACAETGQIAGAGRLVEQLVSEHLVRIPDDIFKPAAICLLAGAASVLGDQQACSHLADWLLRIEDQIVVYGMGGAVLGPAAYWLARAEMACGRQAAAASHAERASSIAAAAGLAPWQARSEELVATALAASAST